MPGPAELLGLRWPLRCSPDTCPGLLGSLRIVNRPFLNCMEAASPASALPSDTALVNWPGALLGDAAAGAVPCCMLAAVLAAPGDIHQKSACFSGVLQTVARERQVAGHMCLASARWEQSQLLVCWRVRLCIIKLSNEEDSALAHLSSLGHGTVPRNLAICSAMVDFLLPSSILRSLLLCWGRSTQLQQLGA